MLQCIAKTEGGKRTVAGVHWDYDCYGELDSLVPLRKTLQTLSAFSQCACSGNIVRRPSTSSHQAEVSKQEITMQMLTLRYIPLSSVAGGTQKLLLGEPTMMPNWDRDAEVRHFASLSPCRS